MREAVKRITAQGENKIIVRTNEILVAAQRAYESVGLEFIKNSRETICPECAGKEYITNYI